jgi:hypothetical protein
VVEVSAFCRALWGLGVFVLAVELLTEEGTLVGRALVVTGTSVGTGRMVLIVGTESLGASCSAWNHD